jgi:hypothetical protein
LPPDADPNRHPATRRTYLLRGYVICALCGHRMFGSTRRHVYMMCQPKASRPDSAGHPGTVSVRHDALMDGLRRFLAEHLLDTNRTERLTVALRQDDGRLDADRQQRLDDLGRHIQNLNQRRALLISSLETCAEHDADLIHAVQVRMAELRAQRDDAEADRGGLVHEYRHAA